MADLLPSIVSAAIGVVGTFGGIWLNHYFNDRTPKGSYVQTYKLFYIKVHHLTEAIAANAPVYKNKVKRLGEDIAVYDELECIALNVFRRLQPKFKWEVVSKGIPDCQILYPWEELETLDGITASAPNFMSGLIQKPSQFYCVRSVRFNGFQPGNTGQGMEMNFNTKEARLIVDVSSLPNFTQIFQEKPKAVLVRSEKRDKVLEVRGELSGGVFEVFATDLKEGENIKMDFVVNWSATRTSAPTTPPLSPATPPPV